MSIGRNDPCPCGSGKKFKKCHGGPQRRDLESEYHESIGELPEELRPTYKELSDAHPRLVKEIKAADLLSCLTAASALLSVKENQCRAPRIEALIHLVLLHATGNSAPSVTDLDRWLNQDLANSVIARIEDPPEDVAIGNVVWWKGNYRVFSGDWSNSDCYLQDILDVLNTAPAALQPLRDSCERLLTLSDDVANRFGYQRLQSVKIDSSRSVWIPSSERELEQLRKNVLYSSQQLNALGILEATIEPFCQRLDVLRRESAEARPQSLRPWPLARIDQFVIILFITAIPMAIIQHVVDVIDRSGQLRALAANLWQIQGQRSVNRVTWGISFNENLSSLLPESPVSRKLASTAAFNFDVSKRLHYVFLHDDPYDIAEKGLSANWQPDFIPALGKYIEQSAKQLARSSEYSGGLTIVVMGGLGRGCLLHTPKELPSSWYLQVWAAPDLNRLMQFEDRWRSLLWKISAQHETLNRCGIGMSITHSDANLYSFWVSQGYRLLPSEVDAPPPFEFAIGPEFTQRLRRASREGIDSHAIYRPDRMTWERVVKLHFRSYFKEDTQGPSIYASEQRVALGVLEGAVETPNRAWWVDCGSKPEDPHLRTLIYQIWESTCNWMLRIAQRLEEQLPRLPKLNLIFELDFSSFGTNTELTADRVFKMDAPSSLGVQTDNGKVTLVFPVEFIRLIANPTNVAERLIVRAITEGAFELGNAPLQDIHKLIEQLDIHDDERFIHMFAATEPRDYLAPFDMAKPSVLHDEDLATVGINIGHEASLKIGTEVIGEPECNAALHAIVDACWNRIRLRLCEINRRDLILKSVLNHERLLIDSDRWKRTSRALLSLHTDKADTFHTTRRVKEQRDLTQIATRVLVEMGVCTCPPDSGRRFTETDSDYILAQIVLLIGTASRSDALRAQCIQPRIKISHTGEYIMGEDIEGLMQDYLAAHFEQTHEEDVRRYEGLFESREEGTKSDIEVFGAEFVTAFRDEYGISPQLLARLGVALTENAIDAKQLTRIIPHEDFAVILRECELRADEIESVYKHFVLHPRDRWNLAEKPFRNKDWWPWRFRRRLSMMARPIVSIGDAGLVYAPAFCEDSFRHTVMEAFTGGSETEYYHTRSMKAFVGGVNARQGLAFNKAVANKLVELGFETRTEVGMRSIGADPTQASGDIDVLAWNDKTILICECKELNFARTLGEVSDQLSRFRGVGNDDLAKHLRRVDWIKYNRDSISEITGNVNMPIRSLLVTSKTVPMQFIQEDRVEVVTISSLTRVFAQPMA